jgi:hypothetical protein
VSEDLIVPDTKYVEPERFEDLIAYEEDPVVKRRIVVEVLAGYNWGPKKIAIWLWKYHRELVPSEALEQAADLVRKDIKKIFEDVDDASEALSKGKLAAKMYEKRLSDAVAVSWSNANNKAHSEPFRAAQMKIFLEASEKLAKMQGVDTTKPVDPKDRVDSWKVKVGAGGVAQAHRVEDEEGSAN